MIKPYKSICKQCGKEKWLQNAKGICPECTFANNHNGKSRQQVYTERLKQKKKKVKKTGERELFLEIWKERSHYCQNKNCRKWLGNEPKAIYFSHRKSKGTYPELRLDKNNIDLLCADCHRIYEWGDRSKIKID